MRALLQRMRTWLVGGGAMPTMRGVQPALLSPGYMELVCACRDIEHSPTCDARMRIALAMVRP